MKSLRPTIAPACRRAIIALVAASAGASAYAASFDCRNAKSPTEHAICGSPRLSALDERLAKAYERAAHALSPAGASQLKESQRGWLRFATRVCASRDAKRHGAQPAECLEHEYGRRIEQLAQAGVHVGPYLLSRVDFHSAVHLRTDDGAGNYAGFATDHVAFAQIDAPLTAATNAWNAAQRVDAPAPDQDDDGAADSRDDNDPASDNDVDFTLGCASERFISISKTTTYFVHGSVHGGYDHEVRNVVFAPDMRKMTANDVFAANSGWKTRLPTLFWNVYNRDPDAGKDLPSIKQAIFESAANPDRWLLTPAGLQISFDADEAGCYACNPGPLTVPWPALKPMLASPEFAACKGPAAARP